jgi:hypothetical protein
MTLKRLALSLALALLLLPGATRAHGPEFDRDTFTVAVIPDTQNYTDNNKPQPQSLETFKQEMQFLKDQRRAMNLVFVSHVGDVVQHGDGTNGTPGDATYGGGLEFTRAQEALDILASSGVPFGVAPGNHDYDNYSWTTGFAPLHGSVAWLKAFGPHSHYFAHKRWYGGASMDLYTPGLSSFQTFSADGRDFLHLSLEMEPGDAALEWAQRVVDAHKGYATIVTTHSYLNPPAETDDANPLVVPAPYTVSSTRYLNGSPGGWNDSADVFKKFIARNDQIFMVLCGHAWGPTVNRVSKSQALRVDLNDAGNVVYQLLTDYQGNTSASAGGDGWLRLMTFDVEAGVIRFRTYSPTLGKLAGQDGEHTFNQPPLFSDFNLPMPVQVTRAARGHVR